MIADNRHDSINWEKFNYMAFDTPQQQQTTQQQHSTQQQIEQLSTQIQQTQPQIQQTTQQQFSERYNKLEELVSQSSNPFVRYLLNEHLWPKNWH